MLQCDLFWYHTIPPEKKRTERGKKKSRAEAVFGHPAAGLSARVAARRHHMPSVRSSRAEVGARYASPRTICPQGRQAPRHALIALYLRIGCRMVSWSQ